MVLTISIWLWRIVLGLVFLGAAWGKWKAGISYLPAENVYDRIVAYSSFRHHAILATEVLVGLWILSAIKPRWSSLAAGTMLLAFVGILTAELFRKSPLNCGCGLVEMTPDGDPRVGIYMSIARNVVLMTGCAWIWLLSEPEERPVSGAESSAPLDQSR